MKLRGKEISELPTQSLSCSFLNIL